jgi:hypothetical protein
MPAPTFARPPETRDLGELQAEYGPGPLFQYGIAAGLLLVAIPVTALALGIRVPAAVAAAPFFGILLIATRLVRRPMGVRLFDRGFVVCRGRAADGYAWGEVSRVDHTEELDQNGMTVEHRFTVRFVDGGLVELDPRIAGVEELGRTISRQTGRAKLLTLVRLAMALEGKGKRAEAIAAFEQVARGSPYNDLGAQAREHLTRLRSGT